MTAQLTFNLNTANPFAHRYFIPHSGVVHVVSALERALERLDAEAAEFASIYIFGPKSSGKTHVLRAYEERARDLEISDERIAFIDLGNGEQSREGGEIEGEFVATYQRLKQNGGLLVVAAEVSPYSPHLSRHISSRILSGEVFELAFPHESELRPILLSLLERRNYRLSEFSLRYLLRRLPHTPLSFEAIFAKINEFCAGTNRPANWATVRHVVTQMGSLENSKAPDDISSTETR